MHNLLLGTGKYLMKLWKERGILTEENFETIQAKVNDMQVPANIGRIPHKISSNFSGFTADQWKNWICIYSMVCLKNILPVEQYECWSHFQDACFLFLQPSISQHDLNYILFYFVQHETLHGKENYTPNMHMHIHLCNSVKNFGPACAFWCFPFERFNGILGSFQNNWVAPERQMAEKFLSYQNLLTINISNALPKELCEFFSI